MKFTAAIFSALLGSAVAAPLEARIVAQEFDVSEFSVLGDYPGQISND